MKVVLIAIAISDVIDPHDEEQIPIKTLNDARNALYHHHTDMSFDDFSDHVVGFVDVPLDWATGE